MAGTTATNARTGGPAINADLQAVAHEIHEEFDERLDPLVIDEYLTRMAAKFDDAKVRAFVPLLVRRFVRNELQALLVRS